MVRSECANSRPNASPTRTKGSEHSDARVRVQLRGQAEEETIEK